MTSVDEPTTSHAKSLSVVTAELPDWTFVDHEGNRRGTIELVRPRILLHEDRWTAAAELEPWFEKAFTEGNIGWSDPLVIIGAGVEDDGLDYLKRNNLWAAWPVFAVTLLSHGDKFRSELKTIARLTGTTVSSKRLHDSPRRFGEAQAIRIEEIGGDSLNTRTTIIGGSGRAPSQAEAIGGIGNLDFNSPSQQSTPLPTGNQLWADRVKTAGNTELALVEWATAKYGGKLPCREKLLTDHRGEFETHPGVSEKQMRGVRKKLATPAQRAGGRKKSVE